MTFIRYAATALVGLAVATSALAITPMPSPMPTKEVITIGYVKVGQVTPLHLVEEELKKMNIEVKRVEFVRYADARTALISNSVDVSVVGPADLAIAALRHSGFEWLNVAIQLDANRSMHPYSGANFMGTCTPTP